MKPLTFIYSHENVFQGVKQESSQHAIRKSDKDANPLFEQLVFDEAYLPKFRELFFDAQAEVTSAVSRYMRDIPAEPEYFETQDFSKDRDYTFSLLMPDDFDMHMAKPCDIKIKQFLIAYIMYRWLETKLPEESAIYMERAGSVLSEAKNLLERRLNPIRRKHRLW
ncbi:MAG: hypothetical protein LBN74_02260 [Prevotella sp.]|jgi:hypothetical protein|nr:hypothetical protein [Prevotella sp.]